MITWYEDCILFGYNNRGFHQSISTLTVPYYEELLVKEIDEDTLVVNYSWVDKVRIKDKIYSKETLEVNFWVFKQQGIICCFGNSESAISYAITRIGEKTSTIIKKVNTFSVWETKYNLYEDGKGWTGELVSLHIKKNPTPYNQTEIKKVSVKTLKSAEINDLLLSDEVTNLSFTFNNTPYYIDTNSVISFPSTITEDKVFETINCIVGQLVVDYE